MAYSDDVYSTLKKWRKVLNESDSKETTDGVPYTMQDELMQSITQTAKSQFGADFSQFKTPMIYYPAGNGESENVILSGVVGSMNDMKFHFKWKDDAGGCYIWTSPLTLTDETLKILSVIYGVYKNWKEELSATEDVKPMSFKNKEVDDGTVPSIPSGNF